jgi:hypothetical protein
LKKLSLFLLFSTFLFSEIVNGIAIRVNGKAITTYDIENRVKTFGVSKSEVIENLIREILEAGEIEKFGLEVSNSELEAFISNFIQQRGIPSKEVMFQQLANSGITKDDFLEKLKSESLRPKLYRTISAGKIGTPLENELRNFFEKNRFKYVSNGKYSVTIYSSQSLDLLKQKVSNPLMFSPSVFVKDETFDLEKMNNQLKSTLSLLKAGDFSQPIQTQQGFVVFYIKDIEKGDEVKFEDVKNRVENEYFMFEQEKFVKRYFEKLREDAIIEYIR